MLKEFPFIGRVVPEVKVKSIREIMEGSYRIVYKVVNIELIHNLTYHHTRKKIRPSVLKKIIKKNK